MPSLLEGVRYEVVKSRKLTGGQVTDVVGLLRRSVAVDYPELAAEQVGEYANSYRESLKRPNRSVGPLHKRFLPGLNDPTATSLARPNQAFARSRAIFALRGDELVAFLSESDNGSSTARWPLNIAETYGKLYLDANVRGHDLMEHRYVRLGHSVMSPYLHVAIAEDATQANPLDVMIALAAHNQDERKSFRTYPWDEEMAWIAEIAMLGMALQEDQGRSLRPFGPSGPMVKQESYMNSVTSVQELAFRKPGIEAATQLALRNIA